MARDGIGWLSPVTRAPDKSIQHMAIAMVFFAMMSICVKSLAHLHVSQMVFFRAWVALAICIFQLKRLGISPWGARRNRRLLIARGVFGTTALILFFTTLVHMPMSTARSLQSLAPIFVTILAVLVLKHRVYPMQWLFFGVAFGGIVMIKGFSPGVSPAILAMGVAGALGSALAYTIIGKIRDDEHPLVIIFYFPLVTIPLIFPVAMTHWIRPEGMDWVLLVLIGIFVQIAQYFMTLSYQKGDPSRVSIVSYLGIIYGLTADFLLFHSPLSQGAILGMVLILAGIIGNTLYTRFRLERVV